MRNKSISKTGSATWLRQKIEEIQKKKKKVCLTKEISGKKLYINIPFFIKHIGVTF